MLKEMLRVAVAVFSELDASAETEEVLTPSLKVDERKNASSSQRRAHQNKVRNWGERDEIDWLFIERAENAA